MPESSGKESKFILGIALIVFGVILIFGRPDLSIPSSYTFASEPVKVRGFNFEIGEIAEKSLPRRILIPELSIDLEVGRASVIDGYWEVFDDRAGWGEGSGLPGEENNQVIFAHAREGLFAPLDGIKEGSRIYVLTDDAWYGYGVVEVKEVLPSAVSEISPTENERLTLYTCLGFSDAKRLVVVAEPLPMVEVGLDTR